MLAFNPTTGKFDVVFNQATQIQIADAGGYYTGTTVEAALQEIGAGTTLDSRYVNVPGDTMTGNLTIQNGATATSAYTYGFDTLTGATLTSDIATRDYTITAQNAWSSAATNISGGDVILIAGDGVGSTRVNDGIIHLNGYKQKITYTADYSAASSSDFSGAALWLDITTSGISALNRLGMALDFKAGYT